MARRRAEVNVPRPHDLLRIDSVTPLCRDAPAWVKTALRSAPWVVVRRDRCAPNRVPVGVRGARRCQRYATEVDLDMIAETLSPPDLLDRLASLPDLSAARALQAAAQALNPINACWGPGGSVGFTLATGVCAMTTDSDLDLVWIARQMPSREMLLEVRDALRAVPVKVDAQLDLPAGGIAVDELLGGAERVLVRTANGPMLADTTTLWR
jgi:phosphoribosyl-dephospho-CoA transferase